MAEDGPNIPWPQVKADLGVSLYRLELRPAAVRALRKLEPSVQHRLHGAIALLAHDPRPPAARALRGPPGPRVLIGDYRVIYTVHDNMLLVVVTVGHRREVYAR
jgi:mRNA interferase RelE/StbE